MENYLLLVLASILLGSAVWIGSTPVLAFWDRVSMRYIDDLAKKCQILSFDLSLFPFYLRLWGGLIFAAIVVTIFLNCYALGVVAIFLIVVLPRQVLLYCLKWRKQLLRDQLITAISVIKSMSKAGAMLEQAIESVALETPAPLNREFRRIHGEYKHGRSLEDSLEDAKQRLGLTGFIIFATTLITNKKHGGNVLVTLEEIHKSLTETQRLERKLESDTATGQFVINALAAFPFVFLVLSYFLNPEGTVLMFTTTLGQIVLAVAMFLVYIGYKVGQKIVNIEF